MPRQKESHAEFLIKLPWWLSAALGVSIFIAMVWIIPAQIEHNQALHPFAVALPKLAFLPLGFFALLAIVSFLFAKKRRRLVDEQSSLEKLRETDFKDFEYLVAEVFRRQGYDVDYSLGRGADGGVDLKLHRAGRTSLVQCKQRKVFSIGAPVIREMFGLMTAVKAAEAIIVTTGKFTRDAQDFAAGKPIQLIDGPQLLALVQSVQTHSAANAAIFSPSTLRGEGRREVNNSGLRSQVSGLETPHACCPSCGLPMILRTSKRGANAGTQFWGCSTYPACKGTLKA